MTLTLGLRYMNSTPPWETNGNQVIPVPVNASLNGSFGAWFKCRDDMRLVGRATGDCGLIETQLGGAANDGRPYFDRDNNNLSPRIAAAWSPLTFSSWRRQVVDSRRLLLVYDRMGMALVDTFDQVGAFGLSTGITNQLGGCNIGATDGIDPCVRWSGPTDTAAAANNVLSNGDHQLAPSPGASFPAVPPSDLFTVSNGLDDTIRNPRAHMIDLSISRELPGGSPSRRPMSAGADEICRYCATSPPRRTSAIRIEGLRIRSDSATRGLSDAGQPLETLAPIPYWENMFPDFGPDGPNGGCLGFEQLGSGCGYSATQVAYDYMIGYHGTAETGSGFGTSTTWQDLDYFAFPRLCAHRPLHVLPGAVRGVEHMEHDRPLRIPRLSVEPAQAPEQGPGLRRQLHPFEVRRPLVHA